MCSSTPVCSLLCFTKKSYSLWSIIDCRYFGRSLFLETLGWNRKRTWTAFFFQNSSAGRERSISAPPHIVVLQFTKPSGISRDTMMILLIPIQFSVLSNGSGKENCFLYLKHAGFLRYILLYIYIWNKSWNNWIMSDKASFPFLFRLKFD